LLESSPGAGNLRLGFGVLQRRPAALSQDCPKTYMEGQRLLDLWKIVL